MSRQPGGPPPPPIRAIAKAIELFQLALLEVAVVRLPLADFVLKGGANMRFFYGSQRRSRDIDFDYRGQRFDFFADRVDDVLASRALAELLRERGLRLVEPRRSKQTATTRRWKLSLAGASVVDATSKIEFSARRERSADYDVRQLDPALAGRLGSRAIRLNRYGPAAIVAQKIGALGKRSETQPRDVFDLDLLLRNHPAALAQAPVDAEALEDASARAIALSYDEYRSTVVDYLDEDVVDVLGTEQAWNDMVLRVSDRLEARRKALRS